MRPLARLILLTLSLCAAVPHAAHAELPAPVRQALRQAQLPANALSVLVMPVGQAQAQAQPHTPPRARLAHREHESMNPASVLSSDCFIAARASAAFRNDDR